MSYRTILEIVVVAFLVVLLWNSTRDKPAPVGQYQVAQKASELKLIPQETLTCKPVTVYVPIAKQEVNLPPDIQKDKDKFVLDASTVNASRRPQELVTVYDDITGKTQTLVKEKDYPWMQALQTGYVGVGYGYTGWGQKGYSAFIHEDLLAIKAIRFGVDGAVYSGGSQFVGVSASYGW